MLKSNCKGQVQEIIIGCVILLVLGLVALASVVVYTGYYSNRIGYATDPNEVQLLNLYKDSLQAYDTFILISSFILVCSLIIGAILLKDYPFFYPIAIILLLFSIVTIPIIANTYTSFTTSSTDFVNATTTYFGKSSVIFDNLALFMLFAGIIMIVCLYGVYKYF